MSGTPTAEAKQTAKRLISTTVIYSGLLTKCEVRIPGYWPSSFLCVYGPRKSQVP